MSRTASFRRLCTLLAARTGARLAADAAGGCDAAAADWDAIALLALEHHVLPTLRLEGSAGGLPADLAEAVEAAGAANAARNAAILEQIAALGEVLNAVEVEPLLLKGAAVLAGGLYPRAWQRVLGDIDLLIPAGGMAAAERALLGAGYRALPGEPAGFDPRRDGDHQLWPLRHADHPAPVELHFAVCDRRLAAMLPTDWAWRESAPAEVGGARVRVPTARLALLHDFVHSQLQDRGFLFADIRLRRLLEFALLRRRWAEPELEAWLAAHVAAHGQATALATYIGLADSLFLGRAGPPARLATRAATARVWAQIRHPALAQGCGLAVNFADSLRPGRFGAALGKLVRPGWYAEKARGLRLGRARF